MKKQGLYLEDQIIIATGLFIGNEDADDVTHTQYHINRNFKIVSIFRKIGDRKLPTEEIIQASQLTEEELVTYTSDIWNIKIDEQSTGLPKEAITRLVKMYSFEGETILDPFLGIGTTFIVAKDLGREGAGYEKDTAFHATIVENLKTDDEVPHEKVSDFSAKQLEELGAIQPKKPEPGIIVSEGMFDAVKNITGNKAKDVEHA